MMLKKSASSLVRRPVIRAAMALAVLMGCSSISDAQPFGGRGFGGRGVGRGGPTTSLLFLSRLSEVHEELELSREQATMLAALRLDLLAQIRGDQAEPKLDPEIADKLFSTILSKDQAKRFDELRLQYEGLQAFDRPQLRTALRVTDEQLEKIRDLRRNAPVEATAEEQLGDVLTDEQFGNWTTMVGEKVAFIERFVRQRQRMRRGGRFRGSRDGGSLRDGGRDR